MTTQELAKPGQRPGSWIAVAICLAPRDQIWKIKEGATFIAMLAAVASLFPLALILLRIPFFNVMRNQATTGFVSSGADFFKASFLNGALKWLYLPLILVIFGIHKYLVPIDGLFPMMMVNAIVWWLLCIGIIGAFLIKRWYRRGRKSALVNPADTGLSWNAQVMIVPFAFLARTFAAGFILFAFMYLNEMLAERFFIVNYRFVYPMFSQLSIYRIGMFFLYWPFLFFSFMSTGVFLHGRIRGVVRTAWLSSFSGSSLRSVTVSCLPLVLFLMVQYVPLFLNGFIPFVGPAGLFSVFVIGIFPVILLLALGSVISTWMYQLSGTVWAGVFLNACIVT